jgi:hypothetical protein
MKLPIVAAAIVLGLVVLGSPKPTHSSNNGVGRYEIAVIPGRNENHFIDTVYRVDTLTGEVCFIGGSPGQPKIHECR